MEEDTTQTRKLLEEIDALKGELRRLRAAADGDAPAVDSETRFRSVVNASPMGVHMYRLEEDDRLVFTGGNPSADRMLGFAHSTIEGQTIEQAFPPLIETEIPGVYRQLCREGGNYFSEQIDYEDDRVRGAFEIHAFGTAPGEMAVLFLDVGERKQAEHNLQRSESRYRFLFENSPISIWEEDISKVLAMLRQMPVKGVEGLLDYLAHHPEQVEQAERLVEIQNVNAASLELFEAESMEQLAASMRQIFTPVSREAFRRGLIALFEGAREFETETELRTVKGRRRDVMMRWARGRDGGDDSRVLLTIVDLTARKRAERALNSILMGTSGATGEEFFRQLVRHLALSLEVKYGLVGELHDDGTIETLAVWDGERIGENLIYSLEGTPCSHAIGEGFCFVPVDATRHYPRDELLAQMGVTSYLGMPLMDARGRRMGILAVMDSKSMSDAELPRHLLEIFASRAAAELERLQSEVERKRLEEQFLQAQKMESIGRLAGGVAHDFNNYLLVIGSTAELALMRCPPGDPLREDLEAVRQAGERAASLTRQLLAFSRKQVLEIAPVNLNDLLRSLERMLPRLLGEDIELTSILDPDLAPVRADIHQIEQVVMNLAVNARDAMPQGGRLTLETSNVVLDREYAASHPEVRPGPYCLLAVSDTGVGMDPETRRNLFEPFYTTKSRDKGTGLGLATVYGIVRQHLGHLNVYSEEGAGTVFKVYLPPTGDPPASSVRSEPKELDGHDETVLVVEDDPLVRRLAVRILSERGYRVLEAASPGEALLLAEEERGAPDLLLTDVIMPQMNGKELYLRVQKMRPGIRVLYMSGYTDNTIVHHGVLEDGTHFLQKPFSVNDLARKVREVLDKKPAV